MHRMNEITVSVIWRGAPQLLTALIHIQFICLLAPMFIPAANKVTACWMNNGIEKKWLY